MRRVKRRTPVQNDPMLFNGLPFSSILSLRITQQSCADAISIQIDRTRSTQHIRFFDQFHHRRDFHLLENRSSVGFDCIDRDAQFLSNFTVRLAANN